LQLLSNRQRQVHFKLGLDLVRVQESIHAALRAPPGVFPGEWNYCLHLGKCAVQFARKSGSTGGIQFVEFFYEL